MEHQALTISTNILRNSNEADVKGTCKNFIVSPKSNRNIFQSWCYGSALRVPQIFTGAAQRCKHRVLLPMNAKGVLTEVQTITFRYKDRNNYHRTTVATDSLPQLITSSYQMWFMRNCCEAFCIPFPIAVSYCRRSCNAWLCVTVSFQLPYFLPIRC